jgi:hypothetical protein
MRYLTLVGLFLLFTATSWGQCSGPARTHANLLWSEAAKVTSPDRAWEVEVHPVLDADENRSPVTIRKCGESKSWPLFTLRRSAEVFWSSDSEHILVVDQPLSGTNKLLLVSVASPSTGPQGGSPDALNKTVNETLAERLGKEKHVQFFLPNFVSWKGENLLLAVGGATYAAGDGPLVPYCYGMRINSSTLHVESVLSEKELKTSTGHSCQVSP